MRDKKALQLMKRGEAHVGKELDIIRFIRRQKMYEIAMKNLFTRVDLFLIKNQRKPFVLKSGKDREESADSSDWIPESLSQEPKS